MHGTLGAARPRIDPASGRAGMGDDIRSAASESIQDANKTYAVVSVPGRIWGGEIDGRDRLLPAPPGLRDRPTATESANRRWLDVRDVSLDTDRSTFPTTGRDGRVGTEIPRYLLPPRYAGCNEVGIRPEVPSLSESLPAARRYDGRSSCRIPCRHVRTGSTGSKRSDAPASSRGLLRRGSSPVSALRSWSPTWRESATRTRRHDAQFRFFLPDDR